jgi:hypothetical protein
VTPAEATRLQERGHEQQHAEKARIEQHRNHSLIAVASSPPQEKQTTCRTSRRKIASAEVDELAGVWTPHQRAIAPQAL